MKMLLHVCCAPCLEVFLCGMSDNERLRGAELTGYFYNPNIHPLLEFRKRLKGVKVLNSRIELPFLIEEQYGLVYFMEKVYSQRDINRCRGCYRLRLVETARVAKEKGFDAFSTTMCVSQHQDLAVIREEGLQAAENAGIPFIFEDLRKYIEIAPRCPGIYKQRYCGCVFSEEERFRGTGEELYKGI